VNLEDEMKNLEGGATGAMISEFSRKTGVDEYQDKLGYGELNEKV